MFWKLGVTASEVYQTNFEYVLINRHFRGLCHLPTKKIDRAGHDAKSLVFKALLIARALELVHKILETRIGVFPDNLLGIKGEQF